MKNRAKCKLCKSIIESFHSNDYVGCKCGEIYVDGADKMLCGAKSWINFMRVDDQGNEIIVKVQEKNSVKPLYNEDIPLEKPTKETLLKVLDDMIDSIENLPPNAMQTPINHYDFLSSLILFSSILRS